MTAHESLVEHLEIRAASDRAFGLTTGAIVSGIGLWRAVFGTGPDAVALVLLVVGVSLAALGLLAAHLLAPVNRLWTRLGLVLFRVVNPLLMLLIYMIGVLPVGLTMRALGKDPLRLRREPKAHSYWIERQPPGPLPDTIENQF
jgi:hypothetical protein